MTTSTPKTITREVNSPAKIGNEDTNSAGLAAIQRFIADTDDIILHHTTFDFGSKVLALTLQGIVLADAAEKDGDGEPSLAAAAYNELRTVGDTGHDREIRLVFEDGDEVTFRMGDSSVVVWIKRLIRKYRDEFRRLGDPQLWTEAVDSTEYGANSDGQPIPIAERVQFWQEQDRLNQALIPRVIAQGKLLSQHIVEHDDLPRIVSDAARSALSQQSQRFTHQVAELSAEYADQLRATADDAIATMQQETAATVSALQTAHDNLAADLRKTRIRLAVAIGVSIALGLAAAGAAVFAII